MVDELNVFTSLNSNDYTSKFVKLVNEDVYLNDIMNHRFFEIYAVNFTAEKYQEIIQNLESENSLIRLVTKEEILNGKTKDNIEIGSNSKSILL